MNATWTDIAALNATEQDELRVLLERHFAGVTPEQFRADLLEKTQVVRLWHERRLVGFSTFAYASVEFEGEPIGAVWSGDTIVDPVAWNGALLPSAWLAAVRACHAGRGRLAWCLICSGVRTFRLLPVFYRRAAPTTTDATLIALRDQLAERRYGAAFAAANGIVRLPSPQVLRDHLRDVPDHLAQDPQVAEFLRRNPGHTAGDELACATWIDPDNLTAAGARIWRLADRLLEGR